MVQPSNRRFVMEDRLNSELSTIDSELATKANTADLPTLVQQLEQLDYAKFDTTYAGGSTQPGMVAWNDTDGTLEFQLKGGNVTLQIGQEQVVRVKNNTGSTLDNGKAVYISGSDGNNLRVAYANASSESTSSGTIGVLTEDLNNGNAGFVTTFGLVRNINTSALTEGAAVWLSTTNGVLTSTRPTAPNHSVMVGFCLRSHAINGVIFVRVDNGWELDELHNVLISAPVNGQALTYDNGVWKNATPVSSLSGLSDVTITSPTGGQVVKYDAGISKWVNGPAAGGVTASATAPSLSTAASGDAWFDTNDGTLYVCYIDPDSTKQWVQVQANSALEGSILARLSSLEGQAVAFGQLSPNYVINGAFDIWQRGTTATRSANAGHDFGSADRFRFGSYGANSPATTFAQSTSVPTGIGVQYSAALSWSTTAGATGSDIIISQHIENGKSLFASRTVTVSFWAKANSAITINSNFDSDYNGSLASSPTFNLTTSWARYSYTTTLPSNYSSSTPGADPSGHTQLRFVRVIGASAPANTINVTGVQVEIGSVATAFRRNQENIQAELSACQRYYVRWQSGASAGAIPSSGAHISSTGAWITVFLPVTMRATPVIDVASNLSATRLGNSQYLFSNIGLVSTDSTNSAVTLSGTISGGVANAPAILGNWNTSGIFAVSAEL